MGKLSPKPRVLIVDDEPVNIKMLGQILQQEYEISIATGGPTALEILFAVELPDLILLDIIMPEMDGYEVCQHIQSDPRTQNIPIVFITAKNEDADETKGFDMGAVDYITKPFHPAIVKARIRTQLDLKQHRDHLEQLVNEKTEALVETSAALRESMDTIQEAQDKLILSEKMAAMGNMVASATHEINNPLGLCLTAASNLEEKSARLRKQFSAGELKRSDFDHFLALISDSSKILVKNLLHTAKLIQSFKTVAVDQCLEEPRVFNLKAYLEELVFSLRPFVQKKGHRIETACPGDIEMKSHPGALSQVFINLVMNSIVHGFENKEGGEIKIDIQKENSHIRLLYHDNGKGIAKKNIQKIFDPFFTTRRGQGGSGLGLHVVYNLVKTKLGGQLECRSEKDCGVTFYLSMPLIVQQ
jgi:signal transduction histidine kinase